MTRRPSFVRSACAAGRAVALLMALVALPRASSAQNVNDGFDPDANGVVRALAMQSDGRILVGGEFTAIGAVTHHIWRV